MAVMYDGKFSITFGTEEYDVTTDDEIIGTPKLTVNTWDTWHLIPSSRISIKPPARKTNTVDIPCAQGILDLSEVLTGYPIYNNRAGNIELYFDYDRKRINPSTGDEEEYPWEQMIFDVSNYLNGSVVYFYLENDPLYYYKGSVILDDAKSNKDWSTVTLKYDLYPYKLKRSLSNTFVVGSDLTNIKTEVIIDDSFIQNYEHISFHRGGVGSCMPFCPKIKIEPTVGNITSVSFAIYRQHHVRPADLIRPLVTIESSSSHVYDQVDPLIVVANQKSGDSTQFNFYPRTDNSNPKFTCTYREGYI